jgi:redox-sensitive bicupin YhaK (pirin superfamily)
MSPLAALVKPRERDLGSFTVRRILPAFPTRFVGPFVFVDHMGPLALPAGQGVDVRPHPHIGLATVTWLWEGALVHRDSLGTVQTIAPGEVNWMTAGRGIVHSERSDADDRARGPRLHGMQTWVALPHALEEAEPAFVHVPAAELPAFRRDDAAIVVIAGHAYGERAPTPTVSDTLYASAEFASAGSLALPADHEERSVYAVDADLEIDGEPVPRFHLGVIAPGREAMVRTHGPARAMLIGGAKLDCDRFLWWNFVSSSRERIERAKADWREQRFTPVPGEREFIPLPEDR